MSKKTAALLVLSLALAPCMEAGAQSIVSRFEGSVEKGIYEADYDAFIYPESVERGSALQRVEGALISRVFVKPADKSNLEVFRSYEQELAAAGFTTLISEEPSRELRQRISTMYQSEVSRLSDRYSSYRSTEDRVLGTDLARIETFPDYYIVARRTRGDDLLTVGIIISRDQHLYMVEEVTSAAMATGTVTVVKVIRTETSIR